jgi:hypothetical protein
VLARLDGTHHARCSGAKNDFFKTLHKERANQPSLP